MRELLENINKIKKRVFASVVPTVVMVLVLVVVLFVGCGNDNKDDNQKDDVQNEENTDKNDADKQEGENEGETQGEGDENQGEESDDTGEAGNEDANEDTNGEGSGSNNEDNSGSSNDDANSGGSSSDSGTGSEAGDEDILGKGTSDEPYSVIPDLETMSVVTVNIPAGGTLYYEVQRVGGMILVIEDANAFVIDSQGNRHDAVNGVVTFEVESAMASDFVLFQFGNKGGSEASFTVKFLNKTGSYANPTAVDSLLNNTYQVHIEAGNEVGHYYKYYAEKDGVIRFSISSITSGVEGAISVTNNRNSVNRTLEVDGNGTYVEIEVQKGDELMIAISVCPDRRFKYPEADITWLGQYAE